MSTKTTTHGIATPIEFDDGRCGWQLQKGDKLSALIFPTGQICDPHADGNHSWQEVTEETAEHTAILQAAIDREAWDEFPFQVSGMHRTLVPGLDD